MKWLVFQIKSTHEAALAIDNYLIAGGASGVTTVDKEEIINSYHERSTPDLIIEDFLDSLTSEVIIEAYFPTKENQVLINSELNMTQIEDQNLEKRWILISDFEKELEQSLERIAEFVDVGSGYVGYKFIKEQDWSENWRKYYDTLKIGRIVINPSWIDYIPQDDEILLNLDPGSAFGTGDHESTSLILKILSDYNFSNLPLGKILDLGTGSGILAIAAAKILPDREILAIDIDSHAIEVVQENSKINQVNIEFRTGELFTEQQEFSLILANLIATLHCELVDEYNKKLMPGGLIIASGIIDQRVIEVKSAFDKADLKLISEYSENDWSALIYEKPTM